MATRDTDSPAIIADIMMWIPALIPIKKTQSGKKNNTNLLMKGQKPPNNSAEPSSSIIDTT